MRDHRSRQRVAANLAGRVAGYFAALGAERASLRSFAEMQALDDRMLRDIGFEREPLIPIGKHLVRL